MSLELAHIAHGESGAPVVILHGLLGSARNWSSIARQLGATHRVFALDLRNHGASPWADADDLRPDGRRRARLPGAPGAAGGRGDRPQHGRQGRHAPRAGARRAGRAPGRGRRRTGRLPAQLQRLRRGDAPARPVAASPPLGCRRPAGRADRRIAACAASCCRTSSAARTASPGGSPCRRWPTTCPSWWDFPSRAPASGIEGPALFVTGGRSDYVRPEHHAAILRLFPNAQFAAIPDAGHWVHAEAPERFLEVVGAFLG